MENPPLEDVFPIEHGGCWFTGGVFAIFSVTVCLTGDSLCDLHGGGPRGSESGEWLPGARRTSCLTMANA